MVEKFTLELSDEIAKRAKVEADRLGRAVEHILNDWVERGSEHPLKTQVKSRTEFPIYTPFGNESTAQILRERMDAYQKGKKKK
jgi:hypothetical protein